MVEPGLTDCVPLIALPLIHGPVQLVAYAEDHVSVALWPALMAVGVTSRVAVGRAGGGAAATGGAAVGGGALVGADSAPWHVFAPRRKKRLMPTRNW